MSNLDSILLIEDSSDDIELFAHAFEKAGIANPLIYLTDGDEACSYLGGHGIYGNRTKYPLPRLVLLDLKLPKQSGFEVLSFIRSRNLIKHTPVVVFTSSNQNADIVRAYELGANSYLVKPVGRDGLLKVVKALNDYWINLNCAAES